MVSGLHKDLLVRLTCFNFAAFRLCPLLDGALGFDLQGCTRLFAMAILLMIRLEFE